MFLVRQAKRIDARYLKFNRCTVDSLVRDLLHSLERGNVDGRMDLSPRVASHGGASGAVEYSVSRYTQGDIDIVTVSCDHSQIVTGLLAVDVFDKEIEIATHGSRGPLDRGTMPRSIECRGWRGISAVRFDASRSFARCPIQGHQNQDEFPPHDNDRQTVSPDNGIV